MRPAITPMALSIMCAIAFNTLFAAPSYDRHSKNNPTPAVLSEGSITFSDFPSVIEIDCYDDIPWYDVTASSDCPPVLVEYDDAVEFGDCDASFTIIREWTATDDCGNQATVNQIIYVVDNTAPELNITSEYIVWPCNLDFSLDDYFGLIEAFDDCSVSPSVIITSEIISGMCPVLSAEIFTITAVDDCGNTASAEVYVTYTDNNPPHEFTYSINNGQYFDFVNILESGGETEVFVAEIEDVIIDSIDDCQDSYAVLISEEWWDNTLYQYYNLCDMCQNCTNYTMLFILPEIEGCTDPCAINYNPEANLDDGNCEYPLFDSFFTYFPDDISIECSEFADFEIEFPEVASECDFEITLNQSVISGDCPGNFTVVNTFVVTDACCYVFEGVQTITVFDTTPPFIEGDNEVFVADLDDVYVDGFDECSEPSTINYIDNLIETNDEFWVFERTYTVCDNCGNCANFTQIVNLLVGCTDPCALNYNPNVLVDWNCVYPESEPTFTTFPSDIMLDCSTYSSYEIVFPEVESECEYELLVDVTEIPGGCPGNLTRVEIFTLNDACCNSIDSTRVVYVTDDEPPVVNGEPIVVVDFLDDVYITATDECSEPVEIEYSEDFIGSNGEYLSYERTYTVCDACLNCIDFTQMVYLKDPFSSILETNNAGMMVFPNPVKEILQIDLQASNCGSNAWEIHDIAGKRLYQAEFAENRNVFTIDSSAWEAGVYLLTVYCGEQRITSKVVKL